MAGKGKAAGRLIKYGPIAVTAAQRWGPVVWEQVKNQREPAEKFVQDKVAKGNQKKKAMAHAATVIDGSVLQVFHLNTAHWVVFSGDDPIAVHPPAQSDFDELLDRADLSKRVHPDESTVTLKVPRRGRRTKGPTAWAPRQEPGTGPHTSDSPVAPARVVRGELTDGSEGQPR